MQEVCRCSWIQCLRIISKSDRTFAFEEKWTNKNFDIEVKVYFTSHRSSTSVEDEVLLRCTIKVKATKREYEKNKLQVVENELYFIILPNSNNARQSRI